MPHYSQIGSREDFHAILRENPNLVLIKLSAQWCPPCHKIAPIVSRFFEYIQSNSPTTPCYTIDIDANPAFKTYLTTKRVLSGVPMLLCYKRGNNSVYPDESCIGADPAQIHIFMNTCIELLRN
jgi:thiol:disulfide interchange protein